MTNRARRVIRRIYDPYYETRNCRELIEQWGGVLRAQGGGRLLEITVRGRRASAPVAGPGDHRFFLRVHGEWLVHIPPQSERDRYLP